MRQVLAHLFSTKTLVRVAFTTSSLNSMGSAFGQGLPAGTMAPVYGSTWVAAQAQSHSLNAQNVASEPSKTARAEAPRTADNKIRLVSHRTGG